MTHLLSAAAVETLIAAGRTLLIAGDESVLARLPRGRWLGGTTPYFMTPEGGLVTRTSLFVNELPACVEEARIVAYTATELPRLPHDYRDGFSVLLLPFRSEVHSRFAREGQSWPGLFHRPLVGWVTGGHLDELSTRPARVFDGATGTSYAECAVALHARLAPGWVAEANIVNVFEPSEGSFITFPESGFTAERCFVDGVAHDFAAWLRAHSVDTRLPLIADCEGAHVNVSFQEVTDREVRLYAPVFRGQRYRLARPVADYAARFSTALADCAPAPAFSCNCILNFLHGGLAGHLAAPITFGEVAYVLLNQTLVSLTLRRSSS